ncbi:MAG: helix-turn-helix domain-containing protein [Reichenbachiella sp.]|uniref:AraC family transcriptional regulator n=1 Tax=Reichenbachiella sp. TaxID=2184521 RepID=UPI003266F6F1
MSSDVLSIAWISIVAYSTIQGYLLFIIFPTQTKGSKQARALLAVTSLLCAISLTEELLKETVGYETFPHMIFALDSVWYFFGPILFFYIRLHCTNQHVTWRDSWHAIPILWMVLSTMEFYIQPGYYKLHYLNLMDGGYTHPIHNINMIIFSVQSVFYMISSWVLLNQSRAAHGNRPMHVWMKQLIFGQGFIIIMSLFSVFSLNAGMHLIPWSEYLYEFWVSGLLLAFFLKSIRSPKELYFLRNTNLAKHAHRATNKVTAAYEELLGFISDNKPYRDPEYDIQSLAKELGYSKNQLNKMIKAHSGLSFRDLMNQHRVEEAKVRLNSSQSRQYTIESIAYDAGFGSLATFYRVFRRMEGTTPKSFIQS